MAFFPAVKQRLWQRARAIKRSLVRFRPGPRPPIAIFGIRRGGSTMLADMVAGERGMWFVDEPFGSFSPRDPFYDQIHARLPDKLHNQFFDMTPEESRAVHAFVEAMLSLELRIGTVRRARPPLVADRVAMKILNAPLLVDWLVERFRLRSVLLTRHPGAQARSVLRQGWGFSAEAYFASDTFCARHFTGQQTSAGREILAGEDRWSKAVLNWILESWIPLTEASPDLPRVAYEALVTEREPLVRELYRRFELEEIDRALALMQRPSNSSRLSTEAARAAIERNDSRAIVGSWLDQTPPDERRRGQEILDLFGVDLYAMDDPMPKRTLLAV